MHPHEIDRIVDRVAGGARVWQGLGPDARAARFRACLPRILAVAEPWVRLGCAAKGLDARAAEAGEEWFAGPMTTVRGFRLMAESLESLEATYPVTAGPGGRRVVRVFPASRFDQALFLGMTGDVWLQPGQPPTRGAAYRDARPTAGVAVVLGAGNVSSIGPLDALYMLAAFGATVVLKLSPVNAYLEPVLVSAFEPLIREGFLAVVSGGSDVADALCQHPGVSRVHLTGSRRTYDAIMWGAAEDERRTRQATATPRLTKPVTAELGCVTPILVVPGRWSERDLTFQARQVAATVAHNASFNCVAGKVLVVASGWPQRDAFLDRVESALRATPARRAYYPGAADRYAGFLVHYPDARVVGPTGPDVVPWTLLPAVPPKAGEFAVTEEAFCGVLAVTTVESADAASFLADAVPLANDVIDGTLSCMLLVDPVTAKTHADLLARAEVDLRYGSVAVNVWSGVVFGMGTTTWGAYPGHRPDAVGSGIGVVHNARLLDAPEKSVVRAPFRMWPKPVWFADHRTLAAVGRRMTAFEAHPTWGAVPGIFAAAVRG